MIIQNKHLYLCFPMAMKSISEFVFPKNFPRYEDTPDPQATVYEGIAFMGVWGFPRVCSRGDVRFS